MYRPSRTPGLTVSSNRIVREHKTASDERAAARERRARRLAPLPRLDRELRDSRRRSGRRTRSVSSSK